MKLQLNGVGRDKDCISAMALYFNRPVTDYEMRFIQEVMNRTLEISIPTGRGPPDERASIKGARNNDDDTRKSVSDNPYSLDNLRTWAFRERGNENNEKRAVRVLFAEIDRLQGALTGFSDIAKRATMEQCAKAMCCGCNEGVERDGAYHVHRYENGNVHRQPCGALPIHNLAAALYRNSDSDPNYGNEP